jgi:CO dehydrogenase maturation factor
MAGIEARRAAVENQESTALKKPVTISVAGKGGTGKTSITALLLRSVLERSRALGEILIVDADPASNIPDILGLQLSHTLGSVLDRKKRALEPNSQVECGLLRDEILDCISQADGFDYLVIGRTTGKGCYCTLHSVLKNMLEEALMLYDLVLIDFDAGLEHFSRQTDAASDILWVVTDPSRMGFETARRIRQLTDEVGASYRHRFLIGCRFTPDMEPQFHSGAPITGLTPLGIVPFDEKLLALNLGGRSIFELDADSVAYRSAAQMWDQFCATMKGGVKGF